MTHTKLCAGGVGGSSRGTSRVTAGHVQPQPARWPAQAGQQKMPGVRTAAVCCNEGQRRGWGSWSRTL